MLTSLLILRRNDNLATMRPTTMQSFAIQSHFPHVFARTVAPSRGSCAAGDGQAP
ncbi:hypothetical protein GCM10010347_51810 [Streptomyces cirratus]|uniref:Uncharacterized protein n=1 Tax=Streptomyces cirratus TaxID=68187 RepID=A0ABQ3EYW4_9ACTN|nr:hypothetical protein GCM10010347_51810 [Streptomyces cirratus]